MYNQTGAQFEGPPTKRVPVKESDQITTVPSDEPSSEPQTTDQITCHSPNQPISDLLTPEIPTSVLISLDPSTSETPASQPPKSENRELIMVDLPEGITEKPLLQPGMNCLEIQQEHLILLVSY